MINLHWWDFLLLADDEFALDPSLNPDFDEEMRDFIHEMWKSEFLPVASQLLQRLETYLSDFEPLEHPTWIPQMVKKIL